MFRGVNRTRRIVRLLAPYRHLFLTMVVRAKAGSAYGHNTQAPISRELR